MLQDPLTWIVLLLVTLGVICYKLNKKAIRDEYIPSDDGIFHDFYVPEEMRK